MADPKTGMARADMKKLLMLSKKEPVRCGAGLASEAGLALLLMDKVKQGRALEASLKKDFPEAKGTAFGTVLVDADEDAKLAKFTLNKSPGGLARRLVKTLKGTGIKKVIINDEQGNLLDSYVSEEEDEEESAPAAAASGAPSEAEKPDAAQIAQELGRLAGGIAGAAVGRPDLQKRLVLLAQKVQALLKSGDPAAASAALAELQQAMSGSAAAEQAQTASDDADTAKYAKAKQAWIATHTLMLSEMEKLRAAVLKTYETEDVAQELNSNFDSVIKPMTDTIDLALADKLDQAIAAKDPAERTAAASVVSSLIGDYQDFLATEPIVAELDDNPFVPLSLQTRLSATLSALAGALR